MMYNIVFVLYLTIIDKFKKRKIVIEIKFFDQNLSKTCFINSIISSLIDSSEQEEFVANSHLSKIIVNSGKNG